MRATFLTLIALVLVSCPAAAFELQRLDLSRTDLDDHVGGGRWTLVMLWTTDCVPCEAQKPMIEAFHVDHRSRDARVVGVALDGAKAMPEIERLIARHRPSYENLVAFDDVFDRQFKALTGEDYRGTPTYLLYTPDGALGGVHRGPIERDALERVIASAPR